MKKFRRILALLLLAAWALAGVAFAEEGGELQVHFLRIGRNDGILISMDGETAFLDGGSRYHGNVAADYMEKLGVTHLNFYVGTHAHSDHVGAACSLLARIPADEILYTYSLAVDCMLDSARTAEEKRVIRETPRRTLAYGDEFTVGAATVRVVGPKAYKPRASYKDGTENENSLILRLEYGRVSFLLCADTTNGVLKALLKEDPSLLKCTVLKSPHHNVGLRSEIYKSLKTDYMIFSTSSKYPPERTQLNLARRAGARVLITSGDNAGNVVFTTDGETISYTCENEAGKWKLGKDKVTIKKGQTKSIACDTRRMINTLSFASTDESIATVDRALCKITGVSAGECDIVVTAFDGSTRSIHVTVR